MVMESVGAPFPEPPRPDLYLANLGKQADALAQKLVYELRGMHIRAERDIVGRGLKAQMKYADKIGARYVIVLGDGEMESGKANLKNMATGEQTEVALAAETIAQAVK